jgi:hypothetical protein
MATLGACADGVKEARRAALPGPRERFVAKRALFADFPADAILLPVQCRLLGPGDMSAVPARHYPLFLPNAVILLMEPRGLRMRQLPFLYFLVNAPILVLETIVHLIASRMRLLPRRIGRRGTGGGHGEQQRHGDD